MNLTQEDHEWFDLTLSDHLKPLQEKVEKTHRAIFGENGRGGGLLDDQKNVRKRLRTLETISYLFQGGIGALLAFKTKIFGG